jgi:hypothetical protein
MHENSEKSGSGGLLYRYRRLINIYLEEINKEKKGKKKKQRRPGKVPGSHAIDGRRPVSLERPGRALSERGSSLDGRRPGPGGFLGLMGRPREASARSTHAQIDRDRSLAAAWWRGSHDVACVRGAQDLAPAASSASYKRITEPAVSCDLMPAEPLPGF